MTAATRPTPGQLIAIGEYLDHRYPAVTSNPLDVLDDVRTLLTGDADHPALDTITALTVVTGHGPTVSLHIDGYRAFLHWAMWLGLAFTRVHRDGGFTFAARGPVSAAGRQLQVHLTCIYDGIPA